MKKEVKTTRTVISKSKKKKNDWPEFNNEKLPKPLSNQSGGWFWIYQDGGAHGKSISPAWWTGEKFDRCNMSIITHFKKMDFPDKPE